MARNKIALIGGGQIGGILALLAAQKELGDVVMLDVPEKENMCKGKMLDIAESAGVLGFDVKVTGTSHYADIAGADVVIVTAGLPRKPGMTRDDLIDVNVKIISDVARNVKQQAPRAFCIIVTNPLDSMVYAFQKITGFPKNRVCGMAGVLDTSRLQSFIALELKASVKDVAAVVLGGHGPTMVPLTRFCTVGGVPISQLMSEAKIEKISARTREAGTEIVNLLGNGSAFVSPAAAAIAMAESLLFDQKRVLPCAALLEGEYGIDGYFIGVPVVCGAKGIEKIIKAKLTRDEQAALQKSLDAVKSAVADVDKRI